MLRVSTTLLSILALSACATLTSESYQEIRITTTPKGAYCALSNGAGTYEIESTPSVARVTRDFSPLSIRCEKDSLKESMTLEARTRGRAYGNLLLLGLPAIVDASTGEGYEYDPEEVEIMLK